MKEYKHLRDRYRKLFARFEEILFCHDPKCIACETNTDEYALEVGTILPRMKNCDSERDVEIVVREEFRRWFGDDLSEGAKGGEIAKELWQAWCEAHASE